MKKDTKPEHTDNCMSCKTKLNDGAARCGSCGRFVGWRGHFFHYASWSGATASVFSLIAIAIAGYFDVLAPKMPILSVKMSEATFEDVRNLTCDPLKFGGNQPLTPATFGDPPGNKLLVEGIIENTGNIAGELRFSTGSITFKDQERIARPLAALEPQDSNLRYFVEAGNTISFAITMTVFRDNSDGFYVAEVELHPKETGRKFFMDERLNLFFNTFESGRRLNNQVSQELDFYLEPVSRGWTVDGKTFQHLCSNL